jgi:hypothetical protein
MGAPAAPIPPYSLSSSHHTCGAATSGTWSRGGRHTVTGGQGFSSLRGCYAMWMAKWCSRKGKVGRGKLEKNRGMESLFYFSPIWAEKGEKLWGLVSLTGNRKWQQGSSALAQKSGVNRKILVGREWGSDKLAYLRFNWRTEQHRGRSRQRLDGTVRVWRCDISEASFRQWRGDVWWPGALVEEARDGRTMGTRRRRQAHAKYAFPYPHTVGSGGTHGKNRALSASQPSALDLRLVYLSCDPNHMRLLPTFLLDFSSYSDVRKLVIFCVSISYYFFLLGVTNFLFV